MKTFNNQTFEIGTLAASVFLASAGTSMANIALPAIAENYEVSFSTVRWVVLTYLIAITIFSLVMGQMGDVKGRRVILLAGIALFTIGNVVCGFSNEFWILILGRLLQGAGAAALIVLPITFINEILKEGQSGRAIGLLSTMSAVGTILGPSLGGVLIARFDWRSVFYVMAFVGAFSFLFLISSCP